eukprot:ANDGO_00824.mRNA.1 hypothetical protein
MSSSPKHAPPTDRFEEWKFDASKCKEEEELDVLVENVATEALRMACSMLSGEFKREECDAMKRATASFLSSLSKPSGGNEEIRLSSLDWNEDSAEDEDAGAPSGEDDAGLE